MCSLSPHVLRREGSIYYRILSFLGKLFEALSRDSGMLLNKKFGFQVL